MLNVSYWQLQAYMPYRRKTLKWWKKLFFHLLTVCAVNGTIILSKHEEQQGRRKVTLEEFFKALSQGLADKSTDDLREDFAANPCTDADRLIGK